MFCAEFLFLKVRIGEDFDGYWEKYNYETPIGIANIFYTILVPQVVSSKVDHFRELKHPVEQALFWNIISCWFLLKRKSSNRRRCKHSTRHVNVSQCSINR